MRPRSATRAARALPLDSCGKCHVQSSVNRRNGHRNFALCGLPVIDMRVKQFFFDKAKVIRAVDKARRAVLSKAGAFIRQRAKTSIRKRKAISAPGKPPSSHEGSLRRFLYFGYDPGADMVVVGPAKTNQVFFGRDRRPVTGTVPSALEYGGQITVFEVHKHGRWQRADLRSRRRLAGLRSRYRKVTIQPRPYMQPALLAELPKLPALWRNSVRSKAA
jgi:hypothetical protein